MTASDQIPADLTLEIGADLSADRFMAAARAFFGYVQELSTALAPEGDVPRWIVRVREGSTLLGVDPASGASPDVVNAVYSRVERELGRLRQGEITEYDLTDPATKYLKSLAEFTERRGSIEKSVPMRLWVKKKPIPLEPDLSSLIREDTRANYHDYGTIEGKLEAIQEIVGTLQFQIRDALSRQRVKCYFPEDLLPEVMEKFRRRVEVAGVIHYRNNGVPISIEAESIEALPDDRDLPTAADVRGILSK